MSLFFNLWLCYLSLTKHHPTCLLVSAHPFYQQINVCLYLSHSVKCVHKNIYFRQLPTVWMCLCHIEKSTSVHFITSEFCILKAFDYVSQTTVSSNHRLTDWCWCLVDIEVCLCVYVFNPLICLHSFLFSRFTYLLDVYFEWKLMSFKRMYSTIDSYLLLHHHHYCCGGSSCFSHIILTSNW